MVENGFYKDHCEDSRQSTERQKREEAKALAMAQEHAFRNEMRAWESIRKEKNDKLVGEAVTHKREVCEFMPADA